MSIRSRFGDYLFRLLFPAQAARLDTIEDELIDAGVACERAHQAVLVAANAIEKFSQTLDAHADFARRQNGAEV